MLHLVSMLPFLTEPFSTDTLQCEPFYFSTEKFFYRSFYAVPFFNRSSSMNPFIFLPRHFSTEDFSTEDFSTETFWPSINSLYGIIMGWSPVKQFHMESMWVPYKGSWGDVIETWILLATFSCIGSIPWSMDFLSLGNINKHKNSIPD